MKQEQFNIAGAGRGRRNVRILFTCAGRRVELIQAFIQGVKALGLRPIIHAADVEPYFAAAYLADKAHRVPKTSSADYVSAVEAIARQEKIDFVVPLIDLELLALSKARESFKQFGTQILISSPQVVEICRDKLKTDRFLTSHGILTPQTWSPDEILNRRQHQFPYFIKPRFGSASKGNFVITSREELEFYLPRVPHAIVQEVLGGVEYTLDVYTGFDGRPRCVVPRRRVEVRGGEVTKAMTVKHPEIIATGVRVVEALGECMGLITIQLFLGPDQSIRVIEVNPRFGGGVPLAIHAGANFPKWLLAEWMGQKPRIRLDHFRDGMLMLRHHQSFFTNDVQNP